jgi:hypothetical protein
VILSNQVRCGHCGETPWSAHRHDFVHCGCPQSDTGVAVDGGMDYLRRVSGTKADFTEMSITLDDVQCRGLEAAMTDKTKNDLGKLCNVVRYLRDELDINVTNEGI